VAKYKSIFIILTAERLNDINSELVITIMFFNVWGGE